MQPAATAPTFRAVIRPSSTPGRVTLTLTDTNGHGGAAEFSTVRDALAGQFGVLREIMAARGLEVAA